MIGKADLVHSLSGDSQWAHPSRHQSTCFYDAARRSDGGIVAVAYTGAFREFGRNLAEKLRLQFGQMGQSARHATGSVMLGEPVGSEHMRETRIGRKSVRI